MPPVAVKVKLKEEINRLESLEVVRREDETTEGCDSEATWKS